MNTEPIQSLIRDIPDFPKPGILFKDITPVLADPAAFRACTTIFRDRYADAKLDAIVAIDARGFLFGAALAHELHVGLVPFRKKGKLPHRSIEVEYELEYGTAVLEMHVDALLPGSRVLIIDDLLATGGTVEATIQLVEQLGADIVECAFLVELGFLEGRKRLGDTPVFAPIVY